MKKRVIILSMIYLLLGSSTMMAQSLAYRLATLEKGGYVNEDDILVKRFDNLVNQLDKQLDNKKELIGDMTYKLKDELRKRVVKASMVKIMEGAIKSKTMDYAKYCGYYLTLREKGYDHDTTIDSIILVGS